MDFTLYHYWRSSASWRVRYALEIKNIKYKSVPVNLLEGEEKKPDYLKLNPNGYVPCLMTEGIALGESLAIIEWLEENHPKPALYPGDSFHRAKLRQFAELINSGIQPLVNLDVIRKFSDDKNEQVRWSQHWLRRGLEVAEKLLREGEREQGSKFCFGDKPTIADVTLIPQCYSALRNEIELAAFPIVHSVYEHAKTTREFKDSSPETFQPA